MLKPESLPFGSLRVTFEIPKELKLQDGVERSESG
jgi:hypothetical protein